MVIKGRSRGNGVQLADYLLSNKENDRAHVLDVRGTSRPHDLKKSLLEMSLSSELTKGVHGLYHAQINPAIGEDRPMTPEDWQKAADILEQNLGFEGQKRAIVLHEKKGRIHAHIVWERYDHESGILKRDGTNYKKHDKAREEIELALGHDRTRQQEPDPNERKKSDYKRELSDLWEQSKDGKSFVKEAEKAGYQIAVGEDRRPWRVITPEGESLDLVRQLDTAKTKDVRERLNPIRAELKTEAEAIQQHRARAVQKEKSPEQSQGRDISDSQDLAAKMIDKVREEKAEQKHQKSYGYSFTFKQPAAPALKVEPAPAIQEQLDNSQKLSGSQERMIEAMQEKRRQTERERKQRELHEAARQKTERQSQDDPAAELLRYYREQQEKREKDRGKDRGGYDR